MKNENTTDAMCVCGHTDHTKYDDGLRGICMNLECNCALFTPATSGESEGVALTIQLIEAHPSAERLSAALNHGVITYADIKQLTESLAVHAEQIRELKLERDSLKRKVDEILCGIDQMETDSNYGWWETNGGAEFGAKKKAEIIALINTSGPALKEMEGY